jgi:hypothetical protein
MKKFFLFETLLIVMFFTISSFICKSVFADGMIVAPDPYSDRWDYSDENNQQAFINYDNGLQKMIISIGFDEKNSNGVVWLFPIPSSPEKIAIDIVNSLPQLRGEEISKKAKSNLDNTTKFLQMSQIYTIPFVLLYGGHKNLGPVALGGVNNSIDLGFGGNFEQDVVVSEHLEKEGIVSEIITAKTAAGLYDYLKSKGLKIETGSIPVLNNYIGKEYSFIASWMNPAEMLSKEEIEKRLLSYDSDYLESYLYYNWFADFRILLSGIKAVFPSEELDHCLSLSNSVKYCWIEYFQKQPEGFKKLVEEIYNKPSLIYNPQQNSQKGIFVTFPTNDIYFPLLPTSVYGSKTVPATIRIIGHVSPKIFQNIISFTTIDYYFDNDLPYDYDLKDFYGGQSLNIKYTKIEINAPSKFLTDDLWISRKVPIKTYFSTFIAKHSIISTIILFVLSSIIAGIFAGVIVFKDLRKNPVKLALIGLSNCLTLFGLTIITTFVNTKNKNESVDLLLTEIKQKGYFWKRRVFIILFFLATLFLVLGLFLFREIIYRIGYGYSSYYISDVIIPVLILYILPIITIIIGFLINRVRIEDKNLFEELKSAGYSTWLFQPKDKMKIVFVPVFSVIFLIVSWLLVKLIGFTV